jgi:hypothetical protein
VPAREEAGRVLDGFERAGAVVSREEAARTVAATGMFTASTPWRARFLGR